MKQPRDAKGRMSDAPQLPRDFGLKELRQWHCDRAQAARESIAKYQYDFSKYGRENVKRNAMRLELHMRAVDALDKVLP